MTHKSIYFYGNKISEYGLQNGRVDYATLAKAFDAVLNNNIMEELQNHGFYFEQESGFIDNNDRIEELQEQIDSLQEELDELENEQYSTEEIYQYFIVSDNGASILKDYNEIVFYCEAVDMYIWGVTHWGTSWDYVLTDIVLELEEVQ